MDNTGPYVTLKELLDRLYPTTFVSYKSSITLSNKSVNTFEYAGSSFTLQVGDILIQGDYAQVVTTLLTTPNRITLDSGTNIVNGSAYIYRATRTIQDFQMMIASAMQTIDLHTGQWFNKRSLVITYEGNNTYLLHLPVPIIEVNSIKLNNDTDPLAEESYHVFNSRTMPDDRRNPRISLLIHDRDIYRYNELYNGYVFYKGMFSVIDGSFGYLEYDGSTPDPIKWVTARLIMNNLTADLENDDDRVIKREKTDLHEIEYESSTKSSNAVSKLDMTGDKEVDRILKLYKSPLSIGSTDPMFATISGFYDDYRNW